MLDEGSRNTKTHSEPFSVVVCLLLSLSGRSSIKNYSFIQCLVSYYYYEDDESEEENEELSNIFSITEQDEVVLVKVLVDLTTEEYPFKEGKESEDFLDSVDNIELHSYDDRGQSFVSPDMPFSSDHKRWQRQRCIMLDPS